MPLVDSYRLFCRNRCLSLDLIKWFLGIYTVPIDRADEEDQSKEMR